MTLISMAVAVMLAQGNFAMAQSTPPSDPPKAPGAPAPPKGPGAPSSPAPPRSPSKSPSIGDLLPPNKLSVKESKDGWILLFDGSDASKSFRGFKKESLPGGWTVVDGCLTRTGEGGDIVTKDEYESFEFVCDWRVKTGGNSGIMWHVSEEKAYPWETGPEMQILDDAAHVDGRTPETSAGACYALYPAPAGAAKPAGEWNKARILVDGTQVTLWLNGVETAKFDTSSDEWKARIAKSKFKDMPLFATKKKGFIALQDHGDEVAFRNIKIRPIK